MTFEVKMNDIVSIPQYDDIDGIISPAQNTFFVGHEAQRAFLAQMLDENRLHHALLMEGARGIGKASLAYRLGYILLAKNIAADSIMAQDLRDIINDDAAINFENKNIWRKIAQGAHPNLLHISRAFDPKTQKFRGAITIDDIRKITHFLQQTSSNNDWRIVIIDSADDMNRNGANALLKTLEEPPKRTIFMLISHNAGRLLPTIRSRCQAIMFKPLDHNDLQVALGHAAGFDNGSAQMQDNDELIANSEGSVRKAALMLAYGGLDIIHAVEDILNNKVFSVDGAFKLASVLSAKDAEVQFSFFIDYVLDRVAQLSRDKAIGGDLVTGEKLSQFWNEIEQQIRDATAYNLDKRQSILVLLQKLHQNLNDCLG